MQETKFVDRVEGAGKMLTAKRILVLIAIVLSVTQILSLVVHVTRSTKETAQPVWFKMVNPKEQDITRRTLVWYIGGLTFLGVAAIVGETQAWLQLSFGIAGIGALLVGCAGGGLSGRVFLWPRFGLSLLTLAILIVISLRLSGTRWKTG